jgi:hypothetical protein
MMGVADIRLCSWSEENNRGDKAREIEAARKHTSQQKHNTRNTSLQQRKTRNMEMCECHDARFFFAVRG